MKTCLAITAKCEPDVLLRAIDSARPFVDAVCVVVAPSSPLLDLALPLPGRIVEEPWEGIAATRTKTLRHAEAMGAEWVLTIDAHATLSGTMPPLADDVDEYIIDIASPVGASSWRWTRRGHLVRAGLGVEWVGAVHAIAKVPPHARTKRWPGLVHTSSARDTKGRFESNADVLKAQLDADPTNTRAAFYYAYSLRDARRYHEAYAAFLTRAVMPGGFVEEVLWSLLWAAKIARFVGEDPVPMYLAAHKHSPDRAEPLAGLAHHYRILGEHDLAYVYDVAAAQQPYPMTARLFVDVGAHSPAALAAAGIAA